MQHLKATLEAIYKHAICNEFDRLILVIGDEGVGKSTLMLSLGLLWPDIRGEEITANELFKRLVWGDRSSFKRAIVDSPPRTVISVMDAARILHKKESMKGEQLELQKGLLDSRFKENLILLGFQDWRDIPTFLQRRRAKNAFVIPRRGVVLGYNRQSLDERYQSGEWPEAEFQDGFPSLEGLEIWEQFKDRDRNRKEQRILTEEDLTPKEIRKREQAKVALRAVKPWDPNAGMTQKDAALLVDYSRTWIRDRIHDWKNGLLDVDLQEELPNPKASAEAD